MLVRPVGWLEAGRGWWAMSSSSLDPTDLARGLRSRVFVVAVLALLAGTMGAAEQASPYDLQVDADGEGLESIPPGSIALVAQTPPDKGDIAAYRSPGDDLAAGPVESVLETDDGRIYTVGSYGPDDGFSILGGDQVLGRLVADVPHVGTPWTLSLGTQVAVNASLVGTYLVVGAYRTGAVRLEAFTGLLGGKLRR